MLAICVSPLSSLWLSQVDCEAYETATKSRKASRESTQNENRLWESLDLFVFDFLHIVKDRHTSILEGMDARSRAPTFFSIFSLSAFDFRRGRCYSEYTLSELQIYIYIKKAFILRLLCSNICEFALLLLMNQLEFQHTQSPFCFWCCYATRENEVRERIPHTCPSSYENFFQSILGSLSILRMAPHWSVKRLMSCSHGNNKQK